MFRLTCGFSGISPAGPVNVDCSVTGGDVESVVCSYDDGAIVEDCKQNNDDSKCRKCSFKCIFQVRLTLLWALTDLRPVITA